MENLIYVCLAIESFGKYVFAQEPEKQAENKKLYNQLMYGMNYLNLAKFVRTTSKYNTDLKDIITKIEDKSRPRSELEQKDLDKKKNIINNQLLQEFEKMKTEIDKPLEFSYIFLIKTYAKFLFEIILIFNSLHQNNVYNIGYNKFSYLLSMLLQIYFRKLLEKENNDLFPVYKNMIINDKYHNTKEDSDEYNILNTFFSLTSAKNFYISNYTKVMHKGIYYSNCVENTLYNLFRYLLSDNLIITTYVLNSILNVNYPNNKIYNFFKRFENIDISKQENIIKTGQTDFSELCTNLKNCRYTTHLKYELDGDICNFINTISSLLGQDNNFTDPIEAFLYLDKIIQTFNKKITSPKPILKDFKEVITKENETFYNYNFIIDKFIGASIHFEHAELSLLVNSTIPKTTNIFSLKFIDSMIETNNIIKFSNTNLIDGNYYIVYNDLIDSRDINMQSKQKISFEIVSLYPNNLIDLYIICDNKNIIDISMYAREDNKNLIGRFIPQITYQNIYLICNLHNFKYFGSPHLNNDILHNLFDNAKRIKQIIFKAQETSTIVIKLSKFFAPDCDILKCIGNIDLYIDRNAMLQIKELVIDYLTESYNNKNNNNITEINNKNHRNNAGNGKEMIKVCERIYSTMIPQCKILSLTNYNGELIPGELDMCEKVFFTGDTYTLHKGLFPNCKEIIITCNNLIINPGALDNCHIIKLFCSNINRNESNSVSEIIPGLFPNCTKFECNNGSILLHINEGALPLCEKIIFPYIYKYHIDANIIPKSKYIELNHISESFTFGTVPFQFLEELYIDPDSEFNQPITTSLFPALKKLKLNILFNNEIQPLSTLEELLFHISYFPTRIVETEFNKPLYRKNFPKLKLFVFSQAYIFNANTKFKENPSEPIIGIEPNLPHVGQN